VIAEAHGRRERWLHDIPAFGAPVTLSWRQRRYRCLERACSVGGFSEDHPLALPRAKLTVRAAWWAIDCIASDNASVASVARRLGVDWHTVWAAIKPLLEKLVDDPGRLADAEPPRVPPSRASIGFFVVQRRLLRSELGHVYGAHAFKPARRFERFLGGHCCGVEFGLVHCVSHFRRGCTSCSRPGDSTVQISPTGNWTASFRITRGRSIR
jgi:hypothetical protein